MRAFLILVEWGLIMVGLDSRRPGALPRQLLIVKRPEFTRHILVARPRQLLLHGSNYLHPCRHSGSCAVLNGFPRLGLLIRSTSCFLAVVPFNELSKNKLQWFRVNNQKSPRRAGSFDCLVGAAGFEPTTTTPPV